jgi:hypothetical protein
MKTTRTVSCKLSPTPEQAADMDATLEAFAAACNWAAEVARQIGSTNKVKVQPETASVSSSSAFPIEQNRIDLVPRSPDTVPNIMFSQGL